MDSLQAETHFFSKNLLSWYDVYKRPLPWREAPSLYKTIVSEFMLQQTQVSTVLPYFKRWMEVFPTLKDLANASEIQVLKYWEGLGYYSRARNLHKLAQQLVALKVVPHEAAVWEQFKGIGPYTAAAITSISFNYPKAVIDGNVIRILSRIAADATVFKSSGLAIKRLSSLANDLLSTDRPGDYNQALMELGATICLKANPLCTICPVVNFCKAAQLGIQGTLPKIERPVIIQKTLNRLWVIHNEKLLLYKIPSHARRLANVYELPLASAFAIDTDNLQILYKGKRGISNERIQEIILLLKASEELLKLLNQQPDHEWIALADLDSLILSGPHKKWINLLL
jgi:A/G-specific adenine glycosylase